jgi:uncharacterized protein
MAEERVSIPVENAQTELEGLLEEGRTGRNAILCHPHPLYGGDMHNNVVRAARSTFASLGWATLRFNFRGPDNPAGGQRDPLDLLEVSGFMHSRSPGRMDFAGYSYGAWALMEAVRAGLYADCLILISPPLDFLSFEGLEPVGTPMLITLGTRDEFCSVRSLENWLSTGPAPPNTTVEILPEVDHFYRGSERQVSEIMKTFLHRLA